MRGLKKLIQSIGDRNISLQERMFRLLITIGLFGLASGIINGLVIGEDIMSVGMLIGAFVFFVSGFYLTLSFHKIQIGAVIMSAVIIFLVLPLTFVTSGGIYGGVPMWFLFGMVFVCLVVEGKVKYVLVAGSLVMNAGCYYFAYAYPSRILQHTLKTAYVDSFVSLATIAVLICGMILFQNWIYHSENVIVQKQNQEIEELNRAQSRFFSGMSHEIRTPINTIIGLNELILRGDVPEEVAEDAGKIQDASKMLLALINDFLDMSKIESGKMDIITAVYDVGAMLSDLVNMIWVQAKEKGIAFHIDVDQTIPVKLIGDEVRIKQILVNVLNNAVKYTQAGSITLSVQSKEFHDDVVEISFTVTDTGMGIKKESIPHLFNAFKRVDEERNRRIEGSGLGLAIVKQLLDLMGGDISVNSVYTKGSSFVITLPQMIADGAKIGEFNLAAEHGGGAREQYKQIFEAPKAHVLIVDDNETNLMVAERLLRDTRVQIDTVTSGAACLKRTLLTRYDVIFMDHMMPEMDGIECLHAVRVQTGGMNQSTPAVILTANAGGEYQDLYRKEGFDGYLLKPVSGRQLEAELLRHLSKDVVNMVSEGSVGVIETPVREHKSKMPVMISTDSVCDLSKKMTEEHQVAVMPYRVQTEGGEFLDGIEADTNGILSYIKEKGKSVKSEAPAVADYEEFFAEQLTKAQYIIHIAMTRKVSLGYENALEASKTFDNVIVMDSEHLSSGMGLMVLRAAKFARNEPRVDEIVKEIERLRSRARTSFTMESTDYLARAGRISPVVNKLCEALMIHPVLVLKHGNMKVGAVRVGTKDYVRKKYISSALKNKSAIDTETLIITYAGLTREELAEIAEQVKRKVTFEKVIYQKASSAISTNCGPGSFGLLFMMK